MEKTHDIQKVIDMVEDRIKFLEDNVEDTKSILKNLVIQVKHIAQILHDLERMDDIPIDVIEVLPNHDDNSSLFDYLLSVESNVSKMKELEEELHEIKHMLTPNIIGES